MDKEGRTDNGTILFSVPEKHHARGVGILMSQRAKKALIGYEPVSDCIIAARFCGQPMNITFIQMLQQLTVARRNYRHSIPNCKNAWTKSHKKM